MPALAGGLPGQPTELLDELRRLDGVREMERNGADVTVHGDRRIIAHVGACLVRHCMVPDDLGVHIPGLEDAVLTLLEPGPDDARSVATATEHGELIGGLR